ncbi:MAG: FAD-dependent oxidoreductase [Deltaproteobacteria bacterium]|nr:FAD-dependent oxidoreductase [Deltaproteobacteria bacterium]
MAKYDYDLAIIGAGSAGLTVAAGAAQLGAKTLLIEKEKHLGGDCLHYGCVPSKTLIHIARVRHLMQTAGDQGLPAVELPPVDFRLVSGRIKEVIGAIQAGDSVQRFCSLGAQVEFGSPRFVDDHAVDLGGRTVSARQWVLATGSSPSLPPVPGLHGIAPLTNREIFYLDRLPASLLVLGAGPIAIEMAQAFNRLGAKVTVVQRSGQILSKEDADLAGVAQEILAREGVGFLMNTKAESVVEADGQKQLTVVRQDGTREVLTAEQILVALGHAPNVAGLDLEKAGVEFSPRGIKVDERLRTSQKHIYAAGDCIGAYLFTHAAGYEGGVVVANAIFHLPRKTDYTWLPWCTYCEPELASLGMNEKRAREAGVPYTVWSEDFAHNDRSLTEGFREGRLKMLLDDKERIIGVQILGPHAGELLNEWVAVVQGGVKLSTLAGAMHPYPTLGEISKKTAGGPLAAKLFSSTVKKGLQLFFSTRGRACSLPPDLP